MSNGFLSGLETDPKKPPTTGGSFLTGLEQKQPEEDSFGQNFLEGFEIGRKGLVSGVSYLAGDVWQMFSADDIGGEKLKIWAEDYQKTAPKSDDSWGQFIGSLVPSSAGIATGITVGMVNPAAGYAIGQASVVGLTASSAGQGMMEYDQYKREVGEQPDALERVGVGVAYGVAEYAMERFALNKFMPVGMRDAIKSLKGNTDEAAKAGKQLVSDFIKKNPTKGKQLVSRLLLGSQVEGAQEAMTELVQSVTDMTYQREEDWNSLEEVIGNMGHAYLGGAIMGTGLGGLSYKAQDVVANKRRKEQGFVRIGKFNGEGVEVVGMDTKKNKLQIMYPDGNTNTVDPNLVTETVDVSPDQFRNLLKGKTDETTAVERSRIEAQNQQKQQFDAQFEGAYRPGIKQTEQGEILTLATIGEAEMVVVDETEDGESVYVTSPQTGGAPRLIAKKDLDTIDTMTVDQWKAVMAPELQVIPDASLPAPVVGEEIEYTEGPGRIVSYDPQSGDATIEYYRTMKNGDTETVPISPVPRAELDNYRKFNQKAPEQAAKEAERQAKEFDEDGKPVEAPAPVEQQEIAPIELELEGQDEPIVAQALEAGVYEVGGKKKKEATDLVKTITEEYPNLSVEVVDKTDRADPMAKSNFVVQIKTKKNDTKSTDSAIPAQQEVAGDQGAVEGTTRQEEIPSTEGVAGDIPTPDIQEQAGSKAIPTDKPVGKQTPPPKPEGGKAGNEEAIKKPVESGSEQGVSARSEKEVKTTKSNVQLKSKSDETKTDKKKRVKVSKKASADEKGRREGAQEKRVLDTRNKALTAEPSTVRQLIIQSFASGTRVNTDSFRKETGFGSKKNDGSVRARSEFNKRIWAISNKAKTIDELTLQFNEYWEANKGDSLDEGEVRNEIIDVLTSYATKSELTNQLIDDFSVEGQIVESEEDRAIRKQELEYLSRFNEEAFDGLSDEEAEFIENNPELVESLYEETSKLTDTEAENLLKEQKEFEKWLSSQYEKDTTSKSVQESTGVSPQSWQKALPEIVEETKKAEPRLKNTDESNIATEYVNPMGPKNKPVVEKEVAKFKKKYPNAPEIVVMESHLDLQLHPAFINRPFEDLYSRNAFFNPADGKAYVVASAPRFKSPAMVEQSLLHEVIGHYGVRKALDYAGQDGGKKFNDFMGQVFEKSKNDPLLRKIYEGYANEPQIRNTPFDKLTDTQKVFIAEEYVAHVAETNTNKTLVQEIIDWFRNLIGLDASMSNDMVRDIIANGRRMVEVGDNIVSREPLLPSNKIAEDARFQLSTSTEGENFRRWFGNSQVINEDGSPMVMYHGTGYNFTEFKGGLIFTSPDPTVADFFAQEAINRGPNPNIMPLYVRSENPFDYENSAHIESLGIKSESIKKQMKEGEFSSIEEFADRIRESGYDGLYVKEFGSKNLAVFDPNQLKSATGNIGMYGQGNDVRFQKSLPDGIKKVGSFTTDEGVFSYYDIEYQPLGRSQYFTVHESNNGWTVRNVILPEEVQGKGIATQVYEYLNERSVAKTGEPLRSSRPRTLSSGEVLIELSEDGERLWKRLVDQGKAVKTGDKQYEFIPQPSDIRFQKENAIFEYDERSQNQQVPAGEYQEGERTNLQAVRDDLRRNVGTNHGDQQKALLEQWRIKQYAQENNLWYKSLGDLGTETDIGGVESRIAINSDEEVIYKSNNMITHRGSISNYLEYLDNHNRLFPDTPYELVGFHEVAKERKPFYKPIVSQKFIPKSRQATQEEIEAYMSASGFTQINYQTFQKDGYVVSDIRPNNVLILENGGVAVIDNRIKEAGADGVRFQRFIQSDAQQEVDHYPVLKSFEESPLIIGDDAYKVSYSVVWDDDTGDAFTDYTESDIDSAYLEAQSPDEYANATVTHSKRVDVQFEKGEVDEEGDFIGSGEYVNAQELWVETKDKRLSPFEKEGMVYIKDYGTREGGARELEDRAYRDLGGDILSEYSGLKISGQTMRKYGNISVTDQDGNDVGSIVLRVADHAYNPRNNDPFTDFISVEIANKNETKGRFRGGKSLQYDSESDYDQIVEDVNERIKEIIDQRGWANQSPRFQKAPPTETKDNFYSNSLMAIRNVNQGKATGDQWKAMLLKNGASQTELDWIGFDEWLQDNPKPSKEEVYKFIHSNKIEVVDVVKGKQLPNYKVPDNIPEDLGIDSMEMLDVLSKIEDVNSDKIEKLLSLRGYKNAGEIAQWMRDNVETQGTYDKDTKYSQYQLPGAVPGSYKEVLLTMPVNPPTSETNYIKIAGELGYEIENSQKGFLSLPKDIRENIAKIAQDRMDKGAVYSESNEEYQSSHWSEPNILAHIRFNEREVNGERVLFVEEIQSDWAQEGRKKGFKQKSLPEAPQDIKDQVLSNDSSATKIYLGEDSKEVFYTDSKGEVISVPVYEGRVEFEEAGVIDPRGMDFPEALRVSEGKSGVPDMPFKQTSQWLNLSLRRMIRWGSEQGFDRIAWINGQQSADRYDLSKQVNRISVLKAREDGKYQLVIEGMDGQELSDYSKSGKTVTPQEMEDTIGKDLTRKAIEAADSKAGKTYSGNEWADFSGLDLKVGGEGMISFYDNIVPAQAKKVLAKLDKDAKVEEIGLTGTEVFDVDNTSVKERAMSWLLFNEENEQVAAISKEAVEGLPGKQIHFELIDLANEYAKNKKGSQQLSFPLTPPIRQKAIQQGLPMFQKTYTPLEHSDSQKGQWLDAQLYKYVDRQIYLKRLIEQKEKQGREITDKMNAYSAENRSTGIIQEQLTQFHEKYAASLDNTIIGITKQEGVSYDEISRYLKAKHIWTDKVENGGFDNLEGELSIEAAGKYVAEFEGKVSKKNIDQLVHDVKTINQYVLEKQLEYGLKTKAEYDRLHGMHEFYVPLRGFEGMEDQDHTFRTKDYKRKGRVSESGDPIPYMYVQAQTAIVEGEQNRVKQALLEFVKMNPDSKNYRIQNAWYLTNPETGDVTAIYRTPTADEFNNFNATRIEPLPEDMTEEQYKDLKRQQLFEKSTITVKEDGKKIVIEFTNPRISEGFKKQSIDKLPKFLQWSHNAVAFLRKAYTQYSPEFGIRNLIRDMSTGLINVRNDFGINMSGKVFKNMKSSTIAVKRGLLNRDFSGADKLERDEWLQKVKNPKSMSNGELMRLFLEMGGLTGYSDMKDVATIRKELMQKVEGMKDEAKALTEAKKLGNTAFKYTLGALDQFNRVTENIMRFSTFKTLIEDGMSPEKAALYAKDVTVNFNRKGAYANAIGGLYLFWNASIQGNERLLRPFGLLGPTDKVVRRRAITTAMSLPALYLAMSMINRLIGGEDEDGEYFYDKLSEYDKTHNFIIPTGVDGKFARIPLPYGYNVFFAWPSHVLDAIMGKQTLGGAALNTAALAMESFSPLGAPQFDADLSIEGKATQFLAPTIAKAPLEVAFNNNFMGTPIYKEQSPYGTPRPDSEMHFSSVDPIMKAIASGINKATGGDEEVSGFVDINPEVIEHYLGSYTGGLGKFVMNSGATMVNLAQVGSETFTTDRIKDVPFVRGYVTQPSMGAYRAKFYDQANEIEAKQDIYNRYKKAGNRERAIEYRQENINYLKMANMVKNYREKVKKLTDLQRRYENMGRMEDAENVEKRLRDLYVQFNKQHKKAIEGKSMGLSEWLGL